MCSDDDFGDIDAPSALPIGTHITDPKVQLAEGVYAVITQNGRRCIAKIMKLPEKGKAESYTCEIYLAGDDNKFYPKNNGASLPVSCFEVVLPPPEIVSEIPKKGQKGQGCNINRPPVYFESLVEWVGSFDKLKKVK